MGKVIYIAGPMTGKENYNRATFNYAESSLSAEGYIVLNPARLPIGMPDKSYLPICMAMLEQADMVYCLEGWKESEGARAEIAYAIRQKLPLIGAER